MSDTNGNGHNGNGNGSVVQEALARGRPRSFDRAKVGPKLLDMVAKGELVKTACDKCGIGRTTLRHWLEADEPFRFAYARAREDQAHALAEEAIAIADSEADTPEAVQRDRLRVDTRKWLASKIAPRLYSERQALELSGPDGGPIEIQTFLVAGQRVTF